MFRRGLLHSDLFHMGFLLTINMFPSTHIVNMSLKMPPSENTFSVQSGNDRRRVNSYGFVDSLTDFTSISRTHGRQLDSHSNLFKSKNSVLQAGIFLFLVALMVKNHKSSFDLLRGNCYERDFDKTRPTNSLRTDQNKDDVCAM